jgi:hypothetical protein
MLNTLRCTALHCNCITDVLEVEVPMVIGEVLHLVWQLLSKALASLHSREKASWPDLRRYYKNTNYQKK